MKRTFCDGCGEEITKYETNCARGELEGEHAFPMQEGRLQRPRVKVTITARVDGANDGDLCKPCLFRAIDYMDPRPRAAEEVAS